MMPKRTKPILLPLVRGEGKTNYDYIDVIPENMTAVVRDVRGDSGYLVTHDGLTEFAITNGRARGGAYNERFEQHFRVSGDDFESISPTGEVTKLGLTPGDGICSMSNSFNTQAILSDGRLYLWDNATLRQVIDPDLGFPIDITHFRGIYVMTDGEFIFQTDINNEYSISPNKYSSSEFSSDRIVAVAHDGHNQILAFNRFSTETFYFDPNVPSGTSVLQPIQGASSQVGIVGTHCKAMLDGVFFILGGRQNESISVHILNAGQVTPVATRYIDQVISKYTESNLQDVVLESRVVDGDKFLIIHLPHETLLYNHTTAQLVGKASAWTLVKTGITKNEPWRGKFGVFDPRATKWIYGDILENKLGYLDDKCAAQYGEQVECICYTPIVNGLETRSIDSFEINTISGFTAGDFSSAFSISYDGVTYGMEYDNIISVSKGYKERYIARRLGNIKHEFNMKFRFVSINKMAFSSLGVHAS